MRARVSILIAVACLAALAAAPGAGASTYCINADLLCAGAPGNIYPGTGAGLASAVAAAQAVSGTDQIRIGSGPDIEVTSAININAPVGNALEILGVGDGEANLHFAHGLYSGLTFTTNNATNSKLENLHVTIDGVGTPGSRVAVTMNGGLVNDVDFSIDSGDAYPTMGVELAQNAECRNCRLVLRGNNSYGINAGDPARINDSTITGIGGDNIGVSSAANSTISRSRFTGLAKSISVLDETLQVLDSQIDMGSGTGIEVSYPVNNINTMSANIDGVTFVGSGRAVYVEANTNLTGEHASATVRNSLIFRSGSGLPPAIQCVKGAGATSEASVAVTYTYGAGTPSSSGCTVSTSNLLDTPYSADDLFVNFAARDLRLKDAAPLVDQGDPATASAGRPLDLVGGARFVDRAPNVAEIDLGAVENQNYAPDKPAIGASATSITAGQSIDFSSSALFDGNGDPMTIEWTFGDGQTSAQSDPAHTFGQPGTYSVSASASDGSASAQSNAITIRVIAVVVPPSIQPPGSGADAPTSTLKLSKQIGKSSIKKLQGTPKLGQATRAGSVVFTASSSVSVKIALLRVKAGYKVGSACRAKQGKSGSAKRCDLAVGKARAFTVPTGTSYFALGKKWGAVKLKPGSHRIVVTSASLNDSPKATLSVIR